MSSYSISYKTTSSYLMGDIGGPDSHYHINFGVRVVNTKITIDGGEPVGACRAPRAFERGRFASAAPG